MLPANWLVSLRSAGSHLPFPIEHQKQPGLLFEPSASPSGRPVESTTSRETTLRENSRGASASWEPLALFDPPRHPHGHGPGHGCSSAPLRDLTSYRCHHPSYNSVAWADQHQGGGAEGDHTPHAPCSQSLHRCRICIYLLCLPGLMIVSCLLSPGFISINSRLLLAIKQL